MSRKINNIIVICTVAGLGIMLFASGTLLLFGAGLVFFSIIAFTIGSFFKENTGNPAAQLTEAMNSLGAMVVKGENTFAAQDYKTGDVLKFERGSRPIRIRLDKERGSTGHGSGGGLYLTVETDIKKGIHLWLARKTLLRMGDKFGGSNCRYYHAKTVKYNSSKFLVGGKDKEQFYKILKADEALKKTLEKLNYVYGYEEIRLGDGKVTARKKYGRGDTDTGRINDLLNAMIILADAILQIKKEGETASSAKDRGIE